MSSNPALLALAQKVVKQQIKERNPIDAGVIEYILVKNISVTHSGEIVVLDDDGKPRVGPAPHYGSMSVSDALDELQKSKPTLFSARNPDGSPAGSEVNPFKKGPHFSMTDQMKMWRSDPERAEHLAYEAGYKIS